MVGLTIGKVYVSSQSGKIYVYGLKKSVSSNITNETIHSHFSLAPNPATLFVTVKYSVSEPASKLTVSFIDQTGRHTMDISIDSEPGENIQIIPLNDSLKSRIYCVMLRSGK